jgi:protein TonB|nr:energy transducer TonB [uncultured Flavobacterium sp.]
MKKSFTLLTLFFSLIAIGQNERINKLNQENQKTGVWKLTSKNKDTEITTEFLEGKYVSETKYYKDKKLVASYNNELNELLIIRDSISTKAKFLINEDASRTLVGIDGTEIDEDISNYFYSFSELEPEYVTGFTGFFHFVAKNFNIGDFIGKIKIKFDIDPNGKVTNVSLMEGNDSKLEKEAKRVFSKLPPWQPSHKDGVFITKTLIFPITRN